MLTRSLLQLGLGVVGFFAGGALFYFLAADVVTPAMGASLRNSDDAMPVAVAMVLIGCVCGIVGGMFLGRRLTPL